MSLNSFIFLFFFGILFLLYWQLKHKWRVWLLLAASYYFYFSARPFFLVLIILITLLTYSTALFIERKPHHKNLILSGGVVLSLGVLFVFKYFNFFALSTQNVLQSLGVAWELPHFSLLLPLGISFFTFQIIGYIVDVYRGTVKAEKRLEKLALFVSFFPIAGAGPIERSTTLLPQLDKAKTFTYENVVSGAQLFLMGLFKKLVIADNLGLVVDRVFSNLPEYRGLSLVIVILCFAWQLYADFSGYTDMARGVARMLGFELLENFKLPYLATSIRDFWRRWHISLSSWFRDYLYIPLGGSKSGVWRTCLHVLIVFTLCGLWHGAAWTFVVWGLLHGIFLAFERLYTHFIPLKIKMPVLISQLYTFGIVCFTWIFFRATTLQDALYILQNLPVGVTNFIKPSYIWATLHQMFKGNYFELGLTLVLLGGVIIWEILKGKYYLNTWFNKLKFPLRWCMYVIAALLILWLRNAEVVEFIYFRF